MGRRGGQVSMLAPFGEGCANYVKLNEIQKSKREALARLNST
jgi:hypothetical protein